VTRPSPNTQTILRHWREAVPDDRLAHLVKDSTRALVRALQMRLAEHGVSFGHWTFLRILWEGTPKGRRLRSKLVPLAEDVNRIAVRDARPGDIATTRKVLLGIIENLARDEQTADMRMPSTRELGRLKAGGRKQGR